MTHQSATQLGRQLRTGDGAFLKRRRGIVTLALFSSAALAGIALYQIGILKRLPSPRWRGFNTEKVNGSAQAYSILATPDAFLGLLSYAVTACLAAAGPENRWRSRPFVSIAMGAKVLADAALAGRLTFDEVSKYRSFSPWSVLVAAATFSAVPLAIPEMKAGLRQLQGATRA